MSRDANRACPFVLATQGSFSPVLHRVEKRFEYIRTHAHWVVAATS
jgi:hypothetical protein